jgi:hypothetical protein
MPITPFLNGLKFDQETIRVMGVALEMVCVALRTGDCDDDVKQIIATRIIDLAMAGERNPDVLCERVVQDIRRGEEPPAEHGFVDRCPDEHRPEGCGHEGAGPLKF